MADALFKYETIERNQIEDILAGKKPRNIIIKKKITINHGGNLLDNSVFIIVHY